jgi:hypothetical protein
MQIQLHNWDAGYDQDGQRTICNNTAGYMIALRQIRNILLAECDFTLLVDSPLSDDTKQEWIEFRKVLRNLPTQVDAETLTGILEIADPPEEGKPNNWVIYDPIWVAQRLEAQSPSGVEMRATEPHDHGDGIDHTH